VSLAGDWQRLQPSLPEGWTRAELGLEARDAATTERAAKLLAPAQPFRASPTMLRFASALDGTAISPDALTRLLRLVDEARVIARLDLAGTTVREPGPSDEQIPSLVAAWLTAIAVLPPDWSDLYAEVRFTSSDFIEPGAVLCTPLNPRREGLRTAMRFRSARRAGYGASPDMVSRCLERCDDAELRGTVEILSVLSDTRLVATQGPTWFVGGRNV
jgi:hypothetical protein